ncbi:ribonuclease D [Rheinheimera sp. YQF-2]|uniref:Ribonuclease D n=1 Tax=Rheinheimera lutimaris TaxID=2740584 RepID=A0A7Y5AMW0_9GAMM|nr:ribonuclease D [Rheinheimera lutimaris]NRQ41320.1 ribonuclease D [Rheinheimera lutimaris]
MIPLITDNEALAAYCSQAANHTVLAVDTEFIRQSTLYPKLGLIQLFDGQALALVDPLRITDWQPLNCLFADKGIIKLLHSCSEDLEALATIGISQITPLFDTQLAAELLGWGSSMGYARLVEQLTGEILDKSESRTDWLARPLSDTQLTYAANDVHFLFPLYEKFVAQMSAEQQQLLLQEGEQLTRRKEQQLPLEFKYLEIKNSWQLTPRELAVLRELAAWRQRYAMERDLALGLILKDIQLIELAKRRPSTAESLLNIPGMPPRELRRHAKTLVEIIAQAKELPQAHCPQRFYHEQQFAGHKETVAQLTQAIKRAAAEQGIPAEFMSVKRQLNEYLNWCWRIADDDRQLLPLPEYMQGWRQSRLLPYLPKPVHIVF